MDDTRDWWQDVLRTSGNINGADLIDLMMNSTFACGRRTEEFELLPEACLRPMNARIDCKKRGSR